jgi:hypothetical protein
MPDLPVIVSERIELIDSRNVAAQLERLSRMRPGLEQVLRGATEARFSALAEDDSFFGYRVTMEADREIRPPDDAPEGPGVRSVTHEVLLQGFSRGADQAAAGTVTITAGTYTSEYNLLLEAPGGDINRMIERTVQGNELVLADGWWDRFRNCLGDKCGGVCLSALGGCISAGAIPAILVCLAVSCGGCAAKCAACATCNCRWWCRWAVGCCRG